MLTIHFLAGHSGYVPLQESLPGHGAVTQNTSSTTQSCPEGQGLSPSQSGSQ